MVRCVLILFLLTTSSLLAAPPSYDYPPPVERDKAVSTMQVPDGFRVEIVAAEPLVQDPVGFDWGPDGKLWVVEMADYPLGIDGLGEPGGRIRILEDRDNDGTYETGTLFLDGLTYPNGLMAWKKGVLFTHGGDIVYAEDKTGDGKCDHQEVLFTGFGGNNPQHLKTGFWWGLDNWVYGAGVQVPSNVTINRTDEVVKLGRQDFRFRIDENRFDPQAGHTQHVRTRDDWGNWFGNTNSEPAFHYLYPDHYLRRNPYLRSPDPRVQISDIPGASPVYPASKPLKRFNDLNKVNRFTSACGPMIYRDNWLGDELYGNIFICEPVHNLVHREVITPDGATFKSTRAPGESESEFFRSTDPWSRPVMARTAPDGSIWIADMYRLVIEHPEWIPDDWEKLFDLRAGEDKGRIYQIVKEGATPREIPRTSELTGLQLVELLKSPNGVQRDMAQQQLVWRNKDEVQRENGFELIIKLIELLKEGELPATRLQALCTLDGIDWLTDDILLTGLNDPDPRVVRHAIRLSEKRFLNHYLLLYAMFELLEHPDPQVQMQLAFSLEADEDWLIAESMSRLAVGADLHLQVAILSSVSNQLDEVIVAHLRERDRSEAFLLELFEQAVLVKSGPGMELILADTLRDEDFLFDDATVNRLLVFFRSLARSGKKLPDLEDWAAPSLKQQFKKMHARLSEIGTTVLDEKTPLGLRIRLLGLVGKFPNQRTVDLKTLERLLTPQTDLQLQQAAIDSLSATADPRIPGILLEVWPTAGPTIRKAILAAIFSRAEWQTQLVSALEAGTLATSDLDASERQQLLNHQTDKVRDQAAKLLSADMSSRKEVLDQYQSVLELTGDAPRGEVLFNKHCVNCHRIGDRGHAVGPDLTALTDKSPQAMLIALLDPNRAIESKFKSYLVVTNAGKTHTGLLHSESGASLELLVAEGKVVALTRGEIEILKGTGKSLMPEGLEKELKTADVADVIAFLQTREPTPKQFAGNTPRVVEPEDLRGEFWLPPAVAEIFGETLVLEEKYGNLGYWQSPSDRAVWTIDVEKPGRYALSIEYANASGSSTNIVRVDLPGVSKEARVPSTGSWDVYRTMSLGDVELKAGRQRLQVRAAGPLAGALLDLKTVRLQPR